MELNYFWVGSQRKNEQYLEVYRYKWIMLDNSKNYNSIKAHVVMSNQLQII